MPRLSATRPARRLYGALYDRAAARPPIIVTGMHRSGTTLLVKLLDGLGVFMGADQSQNGESKLFQDVNRLTLDAFGSSWRTGAFLPSTRDLETLYDARIAEIRRVLRARLVPEYWGGALRLMARRGSAAWGWKDPRNSLLLPLWSRIFPGARLVSIVRDGRDVALSLRSRDERYRGGDHLELQQTAESRIRADLELWEMYNARIGEAAGLFEAHHAIRFERLLDKPVAELDRLAAFVGRPAGPSREAITALVDRSRTRRYERAAEPDAFRSFEGLETYGYGRIGADDHAS